MRALVDDVTHQLGVDGTGLVVLRGTDFVHHGVHGALTGDTVMPIASASKWLAVATVLTLVDEGKLDLDVPVARYVREFDRGDRRQVTLRQCLACTAGFAARPPANVRTLDMDGFAAAAADGAFREQPGAAFRYTGVGFQVAAVAA